MKDKRYSSVKILIETGNIKSLLEIFDTLPRTIVSKDFGTNYTRFTRLINDPGQITIKEVYTLANLFQVEESKMFSIIQSQINTINSEKEDRQKKRQ